MIARCEKEHRDGDVRQLYGVALCTWPRRIALDLAGSSVMPLV